MALSLSLVILVAVLLVLYFTWGGGGGPGAVIEVSNLEIPLEDGVPPGPSTESTEGSEKGMEGETPDVDEPEPEEQGPPLLRGHVLGEGQGIAGADVHLFSVRRVEEALERLQGLIPGGELPDIPRVIGMVGAELNGLRKSARTVTTDESGFYEFRKLDDGGHLVLTLGDGWLFRYGDVVSISRGRTEELDMELERGAFVSGRVVDRTGGGVPGVTVVAEFRPAGIAGIGIIVRRLLRYINGEFLRGPFETTTGAEGSFTIASLPPGLYDLAAINQRGLEARLKGVETGTRSAVIYMGRGGVVEGQVTDTDGIPLAGVNLKVERQDDGIQLPLPMAGFTDVANQINHFLGATPRRAVSAEDGAFRLDMLAAGRYQVKVDDRGLLPFKSTFEIDWDQDLNLGVWQLNRGESFSGSVRSGDGVPLEGARVLASPATTNLFNMGSAVGDFMSGRVVAEVDASGLFTLGGLARGKYNLTATFPGFVPETRTGVATGSAPLDLVLMPGRQIWGRVIDLADGTPLRGARVNAGQTRALSDVDGRFVLDGVLSGSARNFLSMEPARVAPVGGSAEMEKTREVRITVSAVGYLPERESVDLSRDTEEVEIQLVRLPSISGTVYDPDGNPAPGSMVRLTFDMATDGMPPGMDFFDPALIFFAVTVSDLEGEFTFTEFRPAPDVRSYRVVADHVLHARGSSESFSLDELRGGIDEEQETGPREFRKKLEVHLVAATRVTGVVTDGEQPILGATVRLSKAPRESQDQNPMAAMFMGMMGLPKGGDTNYSGQEGRFQFDRIAHGEYLIGAEMLGFTDSPVERITLSAGDVREVILVLDPGGEILGQVVDERREPLPGARVRLLQESSDDNLLMTQKMFGGAYKTSRTDQEGVFQFLGLPDGKYTVVAQLKGYTPAERSGVEAGESSLEIPLQLSAGLVGVVLDAGSGIPITQFRVGMRADRGAERDAFAFFNRQGSEYSDVGGRFERDDLEAGVYDVNVAATGYAPTRKKVFVSAGTFTEEVFHLAQAGRILGVVLDEATQTPIAGARIRLARPSAKDDENDGNDADDDDRAAPDALDEFFWSAESVNSGEDGTFLLEGVPGGPQVVVISHDDYVTEKKGDVEVLSGEELEAVIHLRPGLFVSGMVLDPNGAVAPRSIVILRGVGEASSGVQKTTFSGEDGDFRIGGLEAGTYRLDTGLNIQPVDIQLTENLGGIELRVRASRQEAGN